MKKDEFDFDKEFAKCDTLSTIAHVLIGVIIGLSFNEIVGYFS